MFGMFGNNLRQGQAAAAYQKEEASAKGGKKDFSSEQRLVEEESGLREGGWRCMKSMAGGQEGGDAGCRSSPMRSPRDIFGAEACLSDPGKKAVEQSPLSSLRALPPT